MPEPDFCQARLDLAKALIDARAISYKAKAAYDAARKWKEVEPVDYASALMTARANERQAERALREHIEQHKCM